MSRRVIEGASTGTKNPRYSDVLYLEALIGPDTITTVPPATLDAFRDHGRVRTTLGAAQEQEAERALATAARLGLDVHAMGEQLLVDGLDSFSASFDQLVATAGEKRRHLSRVSS
jgi:transaldolase